MLNYNIYERVSMADNNKILKYILTVRYNPDNDSIELLSEELLDSDIAQTSGIMQTRMPILFKGNTWVLDYMDDESVSQINVFEIAET
jgi:hypothetical protein